MSKEVPWDKVILERFIELSAMGPIEEKIIRKRVSGKSIVEISMETGLSESSINRIVRSLKIKYDQVQKYDPILPVRKRHSVK